MAPKTDILLMVRTYVARLTSYVMFGGLHKRTSHGPQSLWSASQSHVKRGLLLPSHLQIPAQWIGAIMSESLDAVLQVHAVFVYRPSEMVDGHCSQLRALLRERCINPPWTICNPRWPFISRQLHVHPCLPTVACPIADVRAASVFGDLRWRLRGGSAPPTATEPLDI